MSLTKKHNTINKFDLNGLDDLICELKRSKLACLFHCGFRRIRPFGISGNRYAGNRAA